MFYNYVIRLAEGFDRWNVVFDLYSKNSLKAKTRKGPGSSGTPILQITDDVLFPRNFLTSFLCNTDNIHDSELYLASITVSIHSNVGNVHLLLCVIQDNCVISFPPTVNDTVFQIPSTVQEANQNYALHCIKIKYSFIKILSIDTDVLILLLPDIAMKLVSNNDPLNLYFKLVTPNPTWCNIL